MRRFDKRVVIVTGAGSGIGAATVRRLISEGASVAAADIDRDGLGRLSTEFDDNSKILTVCLDLANPDATNQFVLTAATHFGRLHGLAHCAGIRGVGGILDTDAQTWKKVLSVNLDGTFHICQAFARVARNAGYPAAIVNLSSAAGIRGVPNRLPYAASKFGVVGISQTMALELGPFGIRVNAVIPGMINTPMTASMFQDPDNARRIRLAHPLGREGQPEEVAATIAFLLSDDASFITGVALPVDGGKTAGIASH